MSLRLGFPRRYAHLMARFRVPCGFLLVFAFGWLASPSVLSMAIGLPVAIAGLLLRAWAAGHLEKNMRLATTGPYAWLRNPLYLGTSLTAAGFVIASRRPALAVLFALVFALVYLPAVRLEEEYLRKIFPDFAAYAERVRPFWPRPPAQPRTASFRARSYMRNEEYQALLGFLAGVAWLTIKLIWPPG
jgi:protein-S-isoprenylcysteine O-methyltransferase Ste14